MAQADEQGILAALKTVVDPERDADIVSLGAWQFGQEQASTISQPALTLLGSESAPLYAETHELLNQWLPNAEPFVLEGATHMLQWEDPRGVAAGLLAFLARHPMG